MSVNRVTLSTEPTGPVAPVVVDPARPAWLPEKFATPEAFAASYKELETKQATGAPAPVVPATVPPVVPPVVPPAVTTPAITQDAVRKTVADAGLDLTAISKEYLANGNKLTEATLKTLTDKGIPAEAINTFIQGANTAAKEIVADIAQVAGGTDKLATVYEWAKANLTADEIEGYNSIMDAGNKNASKVAFSGLFSRFTAATGKEPALVTAAGASVVAGAQPFQSNAQIVQAMSDPRYKVDPAYRDSIAQRLNVTNLSGKDR